VKKRQFAKIYRKYVNPIYRFIHLKINSHNDSEDLTAEAFFKFWESLSQGKMDKIENPRAMLYKIANNLVIDFYRKKSRTEIIQDPKDSQLANLRDNLDLNEKISFDSDISQVKKNLANIKSDYQNIIILRYIDDLSNKEIAQILGKTEGAVRVMAHRAIKELKKNM